VNPKARNGPSKEKRSDCPLVTLGLVLDGSGFVRRSECFDGNVSEGKTLAGMLKSLGAPSGALVVMDRGLAAEENLAWLREEGYRYLVVSRERERQFDPQAAIEIETAGGDPIQLQLVRDEAGGEVRLHCYSEGRAEKENAITRRFAERFEAGLQKPVLSLSKGSPRVFANRGARSASPNSTNASAGSRKHAAGRANTTPLNWSPTRTEKRPPPCTSKSNRSKAAASPIRVSMVCAATKSPGMAKSYGGPSRC
jgi:hypothetical protein